ncbi:unnamed protein product [Caenorhabditis brenneri]
MGALLSSLQLYEDERLKIAHQPLGYPVYRILPFVILVLCVSTPILFTLLLMKENNMSFNLILFVVFFHCFLVFLGYSFAAEFFLNDWKEQMKSHNGVQNDKNLAWGLGILTMLSIGTQVNLWLYGILSSYTFGFFLVTLVTTPTFYFYYIFPNMRAVDRSNGKNKKIEYSVLSIYTVMVLAHLFSGNPENVVDLMVKVVFLVFYAPVAVDFLILMVGEVQDDNVSGDALMKQKLTNIDDYIYIMVLMMTSANCIFC